MSYSFSHYEFYRPEPALEPVEDALVRCPFCDGTGWYCLDFGAQKPVLRVNGVCKCCEGHGETTLWQIEHTREEECIEAVIEHALEDGRLTPAAAEVVRMWLAA